MYYHKKEDFQLIGTTCLSLASKLNIDTKDPASTKHLVYWCGNEYKECEFLDMGK